MTYVYLLSSYEEHGAEGVVATLYRERLPELLLAYESYDSAPDTRTERWEKYKKEECLPALMGLLEKPDNELMGGHNLSHGWGGIQFHVVELQ